MELCCILSLGLDISLNQREWANDLTTWVIQNKLLYTGPNALDQFCQALLLHLQTFGSGNSLASAASLLLNQVGGVRWQSYQTMRHLGFTDFCLNISG